MNRSREMGNLWVAPVGRVCDAQLSVSELAWYARGATCPKATSFNAFKERMLRDSALISEACDELNQGIFSSCPVGLDDGDIMGFGKAGNCRVI